jgi:transcriptional regulator GlxA family with amidase domain
LAEREGKSAPFEVTTVGPTLDPVTAYGGFRAIPDLTLDTARNVDVLLVPGAIAIDDVAGNSEMLRKIGALAQQTPLVTSVCTGAFILGALGYLDQRNWTTHWEDVHVLQSRVRGAGVRSVRWVDAGDVVTSGGISSGIAMALYLVSRLTSDELASRTARQLEYEWTP